jgi:hypothetical protein
LAGKHRKEKNARIPTKHQVTRWEREKKLSRIIQIVTAAIIVAVVGIIGVWIYTEQVMPYQSTVMKVNGRSFNMDYYINMLDAYTKGQSSDMVKYYVDVVDKGVPQTEALIENAQSAGITVNDEEVAKEIDALKLSKNDAVVDMVKARLIARKYNEQQCIPAQPASVDQVEVQAMLLEDKTTAEDRRLKLLAGDNFTRLASMLSIDPVTQSKGGYLGWIPKGYEGKALGTLKDSALKDVINKLEPKVISDPLFDANAEKSFGYWVLEVLDKDDARGIHARGILFASRDDADAVRQRLVNGESWDSLARQYSQHASKDKGGDLDWIQPGVDKGRVGSIVATLEKGKISTAIVDTEQKTKGGYWIVQVLDKQQRPLPDNIKQSLSEECLTQWVEGLVKNATVDSTIDQKQKDFAVDKVIKNRSK